MQPPTKEQLKALIDQKKAKGEDTEDLEAKLKDMEAGEGPKDAPAGATFRATVKETRVAVSLGPGGQDDSALIKKAKEEHKRSRQK